MAIKEPETEQQLDFFRKLVEGTHTEDGKLKFRTPTEAAMLAGYTSVSTAYDLIKRYRDYYLDILNNKLLLHVPQAVQTVINAMSYDGKDIGVKERIDASKDVLDRAGFAKKDKLEITVDNARGIFVLPAKEPDKELDDGERKT
jgi:hypothetical protein